MCEIRASRVGPTSGELRHWRWLPNAARCALVSHMWEFAGSPGLHLATPPCTAAAAGVLAVVMGVLAAGLIPVLRATLLPLARQPVAVE